MVQFESQNTRLFEGRVFVLLRAGSSAPMSSLPDPFSDSWCDLERAFGGKSDGLIVVDGLGVSSAQGRRTHS